MVYYFKLIGLFSTLFLMKGFAMEDDTSQFSSYEIIRDNENTELLLSMYLKEMELERSHLNYDDILRVNYVPRVRRSTVDTSRGVLLNTGYKLDLAIVGKGWFQIKKDGKIYYTRCGTFHQSVKRKIVTEEGYSLEPALIIPKHVEKLEIQEDGSVFSRQPGKNRLVKLGNIQLALFDNEQGLVEVERNLYAESTEAGEVYVFKACENGAGRVMQGFLDSSVVNVIPL